MLQNHQQYYSSQVEERAMATLLHPPGETNKAGLGLQRSSLEMETIRHLVSAIQTKVLAFWDNLNKT